MSRITKFVLILAVSCLVLGIGFVALAQNDTSVPEEVELDEKVEPEDLEVKKPTILPGSRLYFLKEWGRGIQSFFAFGQIKKSGLEQKFADEKLIELKALIEKGENSEILKKATEKYERALEKIQAQAEKIKEKAKENEDVEKFLDKFTKHQLLHQKILQKLEGQVPEEVFQKIKEVKERQLERFGQVMTKLEDRTEKIKERLEEQMEKMKGSKFKNFKNLEILKELEEKVPEQAKEAIRKAQENVLKRLQGDLEKMSPEDQERFKDYIDKISGDKSKQLQILENLKFEVNPKLKEKILEVRERIMEKVQEKSQKRTCPIIEKPAPDFCSSGRIVIEKDESDCLKSFKCVIPGELEAPSEPTACITLWDPVCGKDGKTYSNACYARLAKVEVTYKGECQKKECQIDADCPQPKCGPLGTIAAKCIGAKAKCIEGRCQIVEE